MRNILTKVFAVIAMSVATVAAWATPTSVSIPQELGNYIVIGSATGADGFASYISKTNCQVDSRLGDAEHSKYYAIGSTRSDSKVNINVTTSEAGNYVFGFKSGASGCSSVVTIKLTAVGSETPLFTSGAIAIANDGNWDPNIEHNFYITGLEADANYTLSLEVKEITSGSYAGNFGNFFFHHVDQLTWATSSAYMELSDGTFKNARDNNDNVINYISRAGGYIDDLLIYNDEAGYRIFHFNIDSHKQASKVTITVTDFATGIQEAQATKVVTANGDYLQPLTTEISAGLKVIRFDFADNDNTADDSYLFNFRWVYFTSPTDYDALPITGTATLNLNQVGAIFSGCRYENDETTKNIGYVKDGNYVDNYYVYNTNAYAYYMLDAGIPWYKKGGKFKITVTDVATGNIEVDAQESPTITATGDVQFNLTNTITSGLKKIRFDFVNEGETDYLFNLNNVSFYTLTLATFTGGTKDHETEWNTATNWSPASVPTIYNNVTIEAPVEVNVANAKAKSVVIYNNGSTKTGKLTVASGKALAVAGTLQKTTDGENFTATTAADIVLESDASNGTGALITGEESTNTVATVQFYSKARKDASDHYVNQYFGIPFASTSKYSYYGSYLRVYDDNVWVSLSSDNMTPWTAYRIMRAEKDDGETYVMDGTLILPGTTTNKDKVLTLTRTGDNMFANSWTAPIDVTKFDATDFVGAVATVYVFNAGSSSDGTNTEAYKDAGAGNWNAMPVEAVKAAVAADPAQTTYDLTQIPSQQAFLVQTSDNSTHTLTLDYKKLVYDPIAANGTTIIPTRAPKNEHASALEQIHLHMIGESGLGDRVLMYSREDFSNDSLDNGWEAFKLAGSDFAPQLCAYSPLGEMSIVATDDIEGTVLGYYAGTADDQFTFTFHYEGDQTWYLNDLQEQRSTLISDDTTYPFTAAKGSVAERRFVISATPIAQTPTGVEDVNASNEVRKLLIHGQLFIIRGGRIYSTQGAVIK